MTKKEQWLKRNYLRWYKDMTEKGGVSLYHAYKDPSPRKVAVWERLKRNGGEYYSVINYSCFIFCVGYVLPADNNYIFIYETASARYTHELKPGFKFAQANPERYW